MFSSSSFYTNKLPIKKNLSKHFHHKIKKGNVVHLNLFFFYYIEIETLNMKVKLITLFNMN